MTESLWKSEKLSNLADMCLGKMLDQHKNKGNLIPYLANLNVRWGKINLDNLRKMKFEEKEFDRYGLKPGDIVMCEGGEPGRCAIWQGQTSTMMIQKALHRIRVKSGINSAFLYYTLLNNGIQGYYEGYFTGAAIKHLTGENLAKIKVKVPPLDIQQKIAHILSAYDDLIENNLKRIELLEEMAQITYEQWFVRLKFPGHETTPIDAETGLPEGWRNKEIREFGKVVTGKTPPTNIENNYGGDVLFIKTPDMAKAPYVIETELKLSKVGADGQEGKYLPENSLLVSCIGTAGVVALTSKKCQFNQQINAVIFSNKSDAFFLYGFAKHLKPLLEALGSNGATMTNVNKTKFERIKVVTPTDTLLKDFGDKYKNNFFMIEKLLQQNQLLKEARDILLPRLMTGMINVDHIELPVTQEKKKAA